MQAFCFPYVTEMKTPRKPTLCSKQQSLFCKLIFVILQEESTEDLGPGVPPLLQMSG